MNLGSLISEICFWKHVNNTFGLILNILKVARLLWFIGEIIGSLIKYVDLFSNWIIRFAFAWNNSAFDLTLLRIFWKLMERDGLNSFGRIHSFDCKSWQWLQEIYLYMYFYFDWEAWNLTRLEEQKARDTRWIKWEGRWSLILQKLIQ